MGVSNMAVGCLGKPKAKSPEEVNDGYPVDLDLRLPDWLRGAREEMTSR